MRLFSQLAALCLLGANVVCSAQDASFRYIVGHNPNNPELRVRMQVARRTQNRLTASAKSRRPGLPAGTDWSVSLGQAPVLFNQYPGVYLSGSTPSCTNDYAIFPSNASPVVGGQANLVLLNQLYSGAGPGTCGSGSAAVQAAYAVGTTAFNGSSPTVSLEGASKGAKVAILERQKALIHIITVGAGGTVSNAISPTETTVDYTNITNSNCTAGAVHTANNSDLWMDFSTDELYVGDDAGKLYHITGFFNGTPTVDFCSSIDTGAYLGIPVHLNISGTDYVFVVGNGNRFFRTQVNGTRTGFTGTTSLTVSNITGGVADTPLIDSSADVGYIWSNHDAAGAGIGILYQVNLLSTPPSVLASLSLGVAETPASGTLNGLYTVGEFDNTYLSLGAGSANATAYTCVYPTGTSGPPYLASFQFNSSGVISGFTAMGQNSNIQPSGANNGSVCTNMDEIYDPAAGVDQLFVGVGNDTNTNANELSRWDITSPLTDNSDTPTASVTTIYGGTSGMVFDWSSSGLGAQTQNMYFGNLKSAPVCIGGVCHLHAPPTNEAIKLQQAGLN
jgi:hypothetical protein